MLDLLVGYPEVGIAFLVAVLVSLTVHEFAHAFVASLNGDDTAKQLGRLTFNPIAHIDLLGAVTFLLIGFGWGKPVPINPLNFKDRKKGEIATSFAGPISNLLLGIIFGVLIIISNKFLSPDNLLSIFFQLSFRLNLALMIFNLIPIPPLDGSHILQNVLPDRFYKFKAGLALYGPQVLFAIIFIGIFLNISVFGWINTIIEWIALFLHVPTIF